jgi:hypothetical protein
LSEETQVMADRRLAGPDHGSYVAYTQLALRQRLHDLESDWIRQDLKRVREQGHRLRVCTLPECRVHGILVYDLYVAEFVDHGQPFE